MGNKEYIYIDTKNTTPTRAPAHRIQHYSNPLSGEESYSRTTEIISFNNPALEVRKSRLKRFGEELHGKYIRFFCYCLNLFKR